MNCESEPEKTDLLAAPASKVDGRRLRSAATRRRIIEAYLALAHEKSPLVPTTAEVAGRAGYSVRSLFDCFVDIHGLQVAVVDHVLAQLKAPSLPGEGHDRLARI